jgi:hypothetical protein
LNFVLVIFEGHARNVEHDAVAGDFDEFVEIERWAPDECGAAGSRAETAFAKQPNGPLDAGRAGFD